MEILQQLPVKATTTEDDIRQCIFQFQTTKENPDFGIEGTQNLLEEEISFFDNTGKVKLHHNHLYYYKLYFNTKLPNVILYFFYFKKLNIKISRE